MVVMLSECPLDEKVTEARPDSSDQIVAIDHQEYPPVTAPPQTPQIPTRVELIAVVLIGLLGAVLLFWNISKTYLWQDEANTAVLATRVLKFGKPLGYDGVNLITNDNFFAEDIRTIYQRTANPKAAVEYYINRGDLKPDTTWKFHPLGQFLWAAVGLKVLGPTTFGARFPFVVAALGSVALLYWLVRTNGGGALIASLTSTILILNVYWILHSRQCRYYSLSGFFFILTLLTYMRWQRGRPWGAIAFVTACWCWFHIDYGTVWPVFGVLFGAAMLEAFSSTRRSCWKVLGLGAGLATALAPSVYYYELWGRKSVQLGTWVSRFGGTCFNVNQYIIPFTVLISVLVVLAWRWGKLHRDERHLVAISAMIVASMALWLPTVAPEIFVRYIIIMAPVGSFLAAWGMVRIFAGSCRYLPLLAVTVLIFTPWLSKPFELIVAPREWNKTGSVLRGELSVLIDHVFKIRPDPNRAVVDWLKQNSLPTDEILINYEDEPLMFYLPNPIRGGIPAFRVEDDAVNPPRFAVIRRSVPFVHWGVFGRELDRYAWQRIPLRAPDVIWGNIPDPMQGKLDPYHAEDLILLRRIDSQ